MINYEHDSLNQCITVKINALSVEIINEIISFIRTIKQTSVRVLILEFSHDLDNLTKQETVKSRLEWSKKGQLFTKLLEGLPFPVASVIQGACWGEYIEVALSTDFIFHKKNSALDFSTGDGNTVTSFGSLKRLVPSASPQEIRSLQLTGRMHLAWERLFESKKPVSFTNDKDLKSKLAMFFNNIIKRNQIYRKLSSFHSATLPTKISALDYLETTIYSNSPFAEKLENITYSNTDNINDYMVDAEIILGADDFGNDFMEFQNYPDHETVSLAKKNRIQEVKLLLEQKLAPIKGRCIELGSGYGYFSAIISKSELVTEAVALDISTAEIFQLGPYMWERLQPDWTKFKIKIADMNKLQDDYGTYDTVIFCASLHHSSDIPKSIEIANKLLKPGGSLILHGEHYDSVFCSVKKIKKSRVPRTIPEFSTLLKSGGFTPRIFRYCFEGTRMKWLKPILFTYIPFKYLNGWFRLNQYMVLGIKHGLKK